MSDTGKTILWIVVAVVVIAVIIWLFTSARRSKEADARRFEASELRAQVQERLPEVQKQEDRASVTSQLAAEAKVEADEKARVARQLEEQAEQHRANAEAARAEHEDLARRADLVDPDVPTDAEGYLVDDTGQRFPGQGADEGTGQEASRPPEPDESGTRATTVGAVAGAAGAGALGAPFTHDEDDEEDLADAENPFAATTSDGSEAAPESETGREPATAADTERQPEAATAVETEPASMPAPIEPTSEQARERVPQPESGVMSEPQAAARSEREPDSTVESEPESKQEARVESEPEFEREAGRGAQPGPEAAAESRQAPEDEARDLETTSPAATVADAVPALHDRDTHVAQGGTPEDDPGDHRGQPWATSPGVPGLEEDSAEPEVQEPQPALDTGQGVEGLDEEETPRRADSEASGERSAVHDDETPPQPTPSDAENAAQPTGEQDAGIPPGRRISTFDEVADGGFGIGSAAPIADGAQPLGHAVKGTHDGRTFLSPGDAGYDDLEPDVWFFNEEAARRAGYDRRQH